MAQDRGKILANEILTNDPEMRGAFTPEVADKLLAGKKTRGPGKKKIMSEVLLYNIKSLSDKNKVRVIRWTRDRWYWYLEIGTRPKRGNHDEFTIERSITICQDEIRWVNLICQKLRNYLPR